MQGRIALVLNHFGHKVIGVDTDDGTILFGGNYGRDYPDPEPVKVVGFRIEPSSPDMDASLALIIRTPQAALGLYPVVEDEFGNRRTVLTAVQSLNETYGDHRQEYRR